MNNYCVYIYLDPRKKGEYIFDNLKFDYEPIYIGKGKLDRPKRHLFLYKKLDNRFYQKLNSIISQGYKPLYEIIKKDLLEEQSFQEEKDMIKLIGRIENNGTLLNHSDGGEGQSGYKHKEETKSKISKSLLNNEQWKETMKSEDYRKKLSESLIGHQGYGKGISRNEETKTKISESIKYRNKIYGTRKHTEESKLKMSNKRQGLNNANSKIYEIKKDNEILFFNGRTELKNYIENYNKENNLTGPNRVSHESIINKGKSKNYQLLNIKKFN